jgi:competence/damage-inducible protein CinA-like protein
LNPILEIFSQGEEVVSGQIVDTNAAWLAENAVRLGFNVSRHTAVGDKLNDLMALLNAIAERADCCICTGGLGPTSDDLTAQAVAQAFNKPLFFDEIAYAQMSHYFQIRNRSMPESNRKQAFLPENAERIDNDFGTAPGFSLRHKRCWFVFLPGVPSEMRPMFLEKVQPALKSRFALKPGRLVTLRTMGIGESDIQQRLQSLVVDPQVQLGFRANGNEVQVKLLFTAEFPETACERLIAEIHASLGAHVFNIDRSDDLSGDLIAVIDQLMAAGEHKLAVIETASQGLLAAKCNGRPWLQAACFEQALLTSVLGFSADQLFETAKALALEKQPRSEADLLLIQLFAESYQHYCDKSQSITVVSYLLARAGQCQTIHTIAGPANHKQNQAAMLGLDLVRRYLQAPTASKSASASSSLC